MKNKLKIKKIIQKHAFENIISISKFNIYNKLNDKCLQLINIENKQIEIQ